MSAYKHSYLVQQVLEILIKKGLGDVDIQFFLDDCFGKGHTYYESMAEVRSEMYYRKHPNKLPVGSRNI